MKVLIDTHILLWWLSDAVALPRDAREIIANPENTVFVSAVNFWEIWLKVSLGRLRLPKEFETVFSADESFEHLPLTAAHTRGVAALPWHHRDPFDRMLIAQAQREGLTFLTADDNNSRYGDFVRLVR